MDLGYCCMTLVYKGIKKETKSRGCGCHKRRGDRISTIKPFHLPSGTKVVFRVGRAQTVSQSDGEWLLAQYPGAFVRA